MTKYFKNSFDEYHAHIYCDEHTVKHAYFLCEQAGKIFNVNIGKMHEKNVGPHTAWNGQLTFNHSQLEPLVSWLEENRQELSVLIHAVTGNDAEDHSTNAIWLGKAVPLDASVFTT